MAATVHGSIGLLSRMIRCGNVLRPARAIPMYAKRVGSRLAKAGQGRMTFCGAGQGRPKRSFVRTNASQISAASSGPVKVYIVIYTVYGHVFQMAKKVKEGIDSVDGCEGLLYQVAETLSPEILEKMGAPPKPDIPIVAAADLLDADGILFGAPTRFGMIPAQLKSFLDSTGGLWAKGALIGKPAGIFFSTSSQGGGQESTALTFVTQLAHHGMIFVPTGYISPKQQSRLDVPVGGSAYGAGTFAGGDGSREPSEDELIRAYDQGRSFAAISMKLAV